VSVLSFWSDPIWKGLRIVSFVSAALTLTFLTVYFSGVRSWRVPLDAAILTTLRFSRRSSLAVSYSARSCVMRPSRRGPNRSGRMISAGGSAVTAAIRVESLVGEYSGRSVVTLLVEKETPETAREPAPRI